MLLIARGGPKHSANLVWVSIKIKSGRLHLIFPQIGAGLRFGAVVRICALNGRRRAAVFFTLCVTTAPRSILCDDF